MPFATIQYMIRQQTLTDKNILPPRSNPVSTNPICPVYDQDSPLVPQGLIDHSRKMSPQIYSIGSNVYLAFGYGLASPTMIVGDDGIIIIDPNECEAKCKVIMQEFRKITDKPVKAVIYTHFHGDHVFGIKAFADPADVAAGKVDIIAHETMPYFFKLTSVTGIGTILGIRNSYTFGSELPVAADGRINCGIGPDNKRQDCGYIEPTITFRDTLDITLCGVRLHLVWVPSECEDEIAIWMPDEKILQTAEVVQGECFPNLHTLRGTRYRNPRTWYKSLDKLRSFPAEYMVPTHGRPVYGKEQVAEVLTAYRDGVQFVYDQTLRFMNKGYTARELAHMIKLPEHLAKHPWLGEYYGAVASHVQEIYQGELGFFDGDPTTLLLTPPQESARRYLQLMGGRGSVLKAAQTALDNGDFQWAAELTTHIIRVNTEDMEARTLKAAALRGVGYTQTAIHQRNWYLSSALELEGTDMGKLPNYGGYRNIISGIPARDLLDGLSLQLIAEKTLNMHTDMAFEITTTHEKYSLEIRRGVAEFRDFRGDEACMIAMDRNCMDDIFVKKSTFADMLQQGGIIVTKGSKEDALAFFACFEWPKGMDIRLTVR